MFFVPESEIQFFAIDGGGRNSYVRVVNSDVRVVQSDVRVVNSDVRVVNSVVRVVTSVFGRAGSVSNFEAPVLTVLSCHSFLLPHPGFSRMPTSIGTRAQSFSQ